MARQSTLPRGPHSVFPPNQAKETFEMAIACPGLTEIWSKVGGGGGGQEEKASANKMKSNARKVKGLGGNRWRLIDQLG